LAEAGAAVASSAPDAVTGAHAVITTLPTAAAVNSVIFGDGVAGASPEDCVRAQMGTLGVTETLGIRDQLAARRPGL
jgi:3-hydroxyisobutyrate dehydrogenase-like beta-hydroxyacid dehydrogenase